MLVEENYEGEFPELKITMVNYEERFVVQEQQMVDGDVEVQKQADEILDVREQGFLDGDLGRRPAVFASFHACWAVLVMNETKKKLMSKKLL